MDTLKKWAFYLPYLNMSLKQGSPKLLLLMDKYWKILRALDINKACGHDEIPIRTLKLCDNISLHPYPYCSRIVLIQGLSRTLERSQILCLFTKKVTRTKLIIIDQSPCYPFLEKFFEIVVFNSIFEYLEENNLLCHNQSGFRLDSCEYQILHNAWNF